MSSQETSGIRPAQQPVSNNKSCTMSAMHNYNADGMQAFVYPFLCRSYKKREMTESLTDGSSSRFTSAAVSIPRQQFEYHQLNNPVIKTTWHADIHLLGIFIL